MGPGQPYFRPPHPPVPKPGLSPLVIVLIVLGVALVVGGGACVVLGGLVMLGASAQPDPAPVVAPAVTPAEPGATASGAAPSETDDDDDDPPPAAATAKPGVAAPNAPTAAAAPAAAGGTWTCNASGSVRVCGFANVCNNQLVFGNGFGKDRFLASTQAKNACENMARAKGGSTVCIVQCTVR
jgi:hypothetical protein